MRKRADHFTGEGRTGGRTDEMGDARTDARRRRAETAVECNTLFRKAAPGARTEGGTDERRENRLVADRIIGKEGTDDRREPRERDSHCTCGRTMSVFCATISQCWKAGLSH